MNVKIENSWKRELDMEFQKPYFIKLVQFLKKEYNECSVFPQSSLIFNAFNRCVFGDVKVVILGQDPYHGIGQAHGLSFSVPSGVKIPRSLINIFKELKSDLKLDMPTSGDLSGWSDQGVLLLNSILTVKRSIPGSHQMQGWEVFTDAVIELISRKKRNVVFILWGAYAGKKGLKINKDKHMIVTSPHPSPFSANRGFFGSRPFSRCNDYLVLNKKEPIKW
ncbi:MAG: uracil-DNA glycosylase [Flavobacteriales bacterium]|nr:uracil-DNA glycosylase [Flavobacteriales bacterium]|tara:strand:+ start:663 stop:1325 length:663 start_codon:yes stop_codon:yes gene_type:complete